MANILSLAVRVTGDASGLQLNPVEKALQRLQQESDKTSAIFEKFAQTSELGAKAQETFNTASSALLETLKAGTITRDEFVRQFAELEAGARETAAALAEGARVTESTLTVEEKRARELERLQGLLSQGAISEETFARAKAEASGANAEAARQQAEQEKQLAESLRARQALESRAASIISANLTVQEKYDLQLAELNALQREGLLTTDQYNRAVASARKPLDDAAAAAERAAEAGGKSALKFNELSGVFAVLPGPLGNIAGRISGITSASEGLTRIFSGGLQSGLSNLVGSFTALATPVNLALAGVTAFAAGAGAVATGLVAFEDRVERLSRLANQLGVSFEFTQVLEEAGKRADVGVQQISGAFARLQKTLSTGGEESKKASQALGNLGISLEEFGQLSERQQIELIGKNLAGIEDPAKRSAAAIDLFGKSGVQLLPFFNELPGAAADIERFGSALSDEDQQRFVALGASFDSLGVSLLALSQNALLPFVELVTSTTNVLAELIGGLARTADAIGSVLRPVLEQIGNVFELLAPVIEQIGKFLLPAVVAQVLFLNGAILAGAISSLVSTFTAAGVALIAFATSGSVAAVSTVALGAAIRTTLSSTGVGALVVVVGLAVDALASWAFASDEVADKLDNTKKSTAALGDAIVELSKDEQKLLDEQDKFLAGYASKISDAINQAAQFGQAGFDAALQYQTAIGELQKQFDKGILNEESFRREAAKAEAAYTAQIDAIKKTAEETKAITDQVAKLLEISQELPKLQQDILATEKEIARVEAEAAKARADGQTARANELASRLSELDQLQAKLEQQADEAAQGFDKGFTAAFESVNQGIQKLTENAAKFGNDGFDAAKKLQDGVAAVQEQVKDGIFGRQAFEAEVARQEQLFQRRLADLEKEQQAREQADKERFQAEVDANERIQAFLSQQFGQQVEAQEEFAARRLEAAENIIAIERQIALEQQSLEAARNQGDLAAAKAGVERIQALNGALQVEQQISDSKQQQLQSQEIYNQRAIEQQRFLAEQQQEYFRRQVAQQEEILRFQSVLQRNAEENARILANYRELATASTQAAQGADIRTEEGARNFIQALQGGFDPQLAVQRQQLKVQQRIAVGLEANLGALGFQTFRFPGVVGA